MTKFITSSALVFMCSTFLASDLSAQAFPKSIPPTLQGKYSYSLQCQQAYLAYSVITEKKDKQLSSTMSTMAEYYLTYFGKFGQKLGKTREQILSDFSRMKSELNITAKENKNKMLSIVDSCQAFG